MRPGVAADIPPRGQQHEPGHTELQPDQREQRQHVNDHADSLAPPRITRGQRRLHPVQGHSLCPSQAVMPSVRANARASRETIGPPEVTSSPVIPRPIGWQDSDSVLTAATRCNALRVAMLSPRW